ncbi:MAG: RNA-binding protein [Gammaproteobacteria bacterium SHHR-1]|uniref:RNA recognition motif domain-containing protein n=1 Tax=Magnetovirga frankeli TaxID=947516 RepID=UPI001293AF2A|nr:RNA-binding protein [gamma proteobacterium SS-5]
MILILCNIPSVSSLDDLRQFIEKYSKSWNPLKRSVEVSGCEILEILDPTTGDRELHGLVNIPNFQQANAAIQRLNGRKLLGRPVRVREYVYRSPGDRRVNLRCQGLNRPEDRRRAQLKVRRHGEEVEAATHNLLSDTPLG